MREKAKEYFETFKKVLDEVAASGANGEAYKFDEAIDRSICMILDQAASNKKIMLIGNGASASIASHIATDLWKNTGIRATAFNDASSLTCVSNDLGYSHVFEKPIETFANSGDILIAISSSGKSENILLAVQAARKRGVKVITLSGFDKDNPLRKLGDINFYVPSPNYGSVEVIHHSICHCFIDMIIIGLCFTNETEEANKKKHKEGEAA